MRKIISVLLALIFILSAAPGVISAQTIENVDLPYQAIIYGTEGEGLALKAQPDANSQRYMLLYDGTEVTVQQESSNGWGYISYAGYSGWIYLEYTRMVYPPTYLVSVYDTDGEGLALKEQADINSKRIISIKDGTQLTILAEDENGWGYVFYGGYYGWVFLRYTRVISGRKAQVPDALWTTSQYYVVNNTEGKGLELRCDPNGESSTYGPVPEGTGLYVTAQDGNYMYTSYNGKNGWVHKDYLE